MTKYNFPVTNIYEAMEVTAPDFSITQVEKWETELYVEGGLNTFNQCFDDYLFCLGIVNDSIIQKPSKSQKAIFYGHKGTGKSVLLHKLNDYLDKKTDYIPIYINLVDFFEIAEMQKEDVYVAIISAFLYTMDKEQIPVDNRIFKEIIAEWLQDDKFSKELEKQIGFEPSLGGGIADSFLSFIKLQANIKGIFSWKSKVTDTIRRSINQNGKTILDKLNLAFAELRQRHLKGNKDIIFIIDGLEKARPSVYQTLFIEDIALINSFNAHAIYCVPIRTFYDVKNRFTREDLLPIYLPLYRYNDPTKRFFNALINQRIDNKFWDNKAVVLDYFIHYAAGSPRQFFVFIKRALLEAKGKPITLDIAKKIIHKEYIEMRRPLRDEHIAVLQHKQFNNLSEALLDLMVNLCIVEYNGNSIERKMNPLLAREFYTDAEFQAIYLFDK